MQVCSVAFGAPSTGQNVFTLFKTDVKLKFDLYISNFCDLLKGHQYHQYPGSLKIVLDVSRVNKKINCTYY